MATPRSDRAGDRATSWAAATWTVPVLPGAVVLAWAALGGLPVVAGLGLTGPVWFALAAVAAGLAGYRFGGRRVRGIGLGCVVGGALTAVLVATLSLS